MNIDERANLKIPVDVKKELKVEAARWDTSMEAISSSVLVALLAKMKTLDPKRDTIEDAISAAIYPPPSKEPSPTLHPDPAPVSNPLLPTEYIDRPRRSATITASAPNAEGRHGPNIHLTPGEVPWVIRFINILRSGTVAARGIKWNIMMVLKASGLWDNASNTILPAPSEDNERASRKEIELAERLIADAEAAPQVHPADRKRRSKSSRGR